MPATELELQAQLAAARAQIDALMAQQAQQKASPLEAGKDEVYRRMDADLWDKPILQDCCFHKKFYVPKVFPKLNASKYF